ncbi:MAG: diguanylate cyclase [Spirochaetota bacterium]|nr:diguanylate cyclase [Spirochaetota bacterium]
MITKIISLLKKIYPGEIIFTVTIIGILNYYISSEDPGLLNVSFNPYLTVIIFFSIFYGKLSGIFTLVLSVIIIIINSIIMIYPTFHIQKLIDLYSSSDRYNLSIQFIFVSFIASIIFGEIRDTLGNRIQHYKDKNETLRKKNVKLQHELDAVSLINEEYQDRILGQQNSLISLYSTMIALNSLDLKKIYPNILDAVVKFSGATRCSLWQYHRDDSSLKLLSSYGWKESDIKLNSSISDSDNITGWVARNNVIFSVKMLQKNKKLHDIDSKQNIITVPVNINNQVWGIINIEEIPFVKYNLYSEQLVTMISDLAAPTINNATRFSEITKKGETDPITGLYSVDELFTVLDKEFTRSSSENLNLSFLIIELSNPEELVESYSNKEALQLLKDISQFVMQTTKGKSMIFQYKEKFQFSVILPNMDYDGAVMFCLNLIEQHSSHYYSIRGEQVYPEIILGYSSLRPNIESSEDLLLLAENLLMMQKL